MQRAFTSRAGILLVAALGAVLGIALLEDSNPLDGALVLSGIIRYPTDSVMGVYFLNSWTALHQLGAAALLLGAGQETAMGILNAAYGACTLTAVLLISRFLLRQFWLTLAVTLLVLLYGLPVRFDDYPQGFNDADYGAWAVTSFFLPLGLLGSRRMFAAGVAALAAPAIHPVVGAWTAFVICGAVLCTARNDPAGARQFLKGAVAGALLAALSFVWFWLARTPDLQGADAELYRVYMDVWEGHRRSPHNASVLALGAVCVCVAAALLGRRRAAKDADGAVALWALLIGAGASTVVYEVVHRYGGDLPDLVTRAMPARVAVMHLTLLLPIGLAALLQRRWPVLVLSALAGSAALLHPVAGLAATALAGAWLYADRPVLPGFAREWPMVLRSVLGILVCGAFAWQLLDNMAGEKWRARAAQSDKPAIWLAIESRLKPPPEEPEAPAYFGGLGAEGWKLARSIHKQGVVAAPGPMLWELRLRLHLPILLETTSFDFIPYLPETVTQVAGIIQDVYGVDFRNPPASQRGSASLREDDGKDYWPTLSAEEWAKLGQKYCIGGVIAPAGWTVRLPVAHDFGTAKYYRVTAELPPGCR